MCKQCIDLLRQEFPDSTDKERHDVLWMATAYPAADADHVCKQIVEIAEQSGHNADKACEIADQEMDLDKKTLK